jgi:hypothetical protein
MDNQNDIKIASQKLQEKIGEPNEVQERKVA